MEGFDVVVPCQSGGTQHEHTIRVEHGPPIYGVTSPPNVRLQYTCPLTGKALIATFRPPQGAGRPFTVIGVR